VCPSGVAVDWSQPSLVAGLDEALPDMGRHVSRPGYEVVEVASAVPDRGPGKYRLGGEVEQPSDVIDVVVGNDHVGHLGRHDAVGAQAGEELPAGEQEHPLHDLRAEPRIDEHDSLAGSNQKAAER